MSYVDKWHQYQERNRAIALEGPARILDGARFTLDASKEFLDALQGWCEEAMADGYPLENVIPDVLTFQAAWCDAAKGLCNIVCQEPGAAAELETNEESEMAGPVFIDGFTGTSAQIDSTDLVNEADPTALIPKANVMLRALPAGGIMITLVGIRQLVAVLPAGTYRGEIQRVADGTTVAELVNVHSVKGQALFVLRSGTLFV